MMVDSITSMITLQAGQLQRLQQVTVDTLFSLADGLAQYAGLQTQVLDSLHHHVAGDWLPGLQGQPYVLYI